MSKKHQWEVRRNVTTGKPYRVRVLRQKPGPPPGIDEFPLPDVEGHLSETPPLRGMFVPPTLAAEQASALEVTDERRGRLARDLRERK